jgi:hypothetical protein
MSCDGWILRMLMFAGSPVPKILDGFVGLERFLEK